MGTRRTWRERLAILGAAGLPVLAGCIGDSTRKDGQDKIDPALMMTIQKPQLAEKPAPSVDVLIRTRGEIDAAQRATLERHGARIGSVMGDVLTASVSLQSVSEIANLEFVVRIEMSKQQRLR